ncbi:MAG: AAA+ family ATPase, partial [Chlorobium sp.]
QKNLNLSPYQVTQAENQKSSAESAVTARLPETWQWLLVPVQSSPQAPITWEAVRLTGSDPLAVRASKKLRTDELFLTSFAPTRLRMELDRIPLWRGDHVAVKQLVEDFARYLYLPRLKNPAVLLGAISAGLSLLTWSQDSFGFADSFDESAGRYRGLRNGMVIHLTDPHSSELVVKPDVAIRQIEAERAELSAPVLLPNDGETGDGSVGTVQQGNGHRGETPSAVSSKPKRFHGTATLDATRVGRDASKIAEEVIAHLAGIVGARVNVTIEIEAELPDGAPDNVVRTVTENSRTLKFTSQGFEKE